MLLGKTCLYVNTKISKLTESNSQLYVRVTFINILTSTRNSIHTVLLLPEACPARLHPICVRLSEFSRDFKTGQSKELTFSNSVYHNCIDHTHELLRSWIYQRAFNVVSLSILTEQSHISVNIIQTSILVYLYILTDLLKVHRFSDDIVVIW